MTFPMPFFHPGRPSRYCSPIRDDVTQLSDTIGGSPLYDTDTGLVVRVDQSTGILTFYDYELGQDVEQIDWGGGGLDNATLFLFHGAPGTFWAVRDNAEARIFSFSLMSLIEVVDTNTDWYERCAWSDYNDKMIMASSNLTENIRVYQKGSPAGAVAVENDWSYTQYSTVNSAYNLWGDVLVIPATGDRSVNAGDEAGWIVLWNGDALVVLDTEYSIHLDHRVDVADRYTNYGTQAINLQYDWRRHKVYVNQGAENLLFVLDMSALTVTRHAISMGTGSILYHEQTDLLMGISGGDAPTFSIADPDDLPNKVVSFALDAVNSPINAPESRITGNLVEIEGLLDAVLVASDLNSTVAEGLFKIPFGTCN